MPGRGKTWRDAARAIIREVVNDVGVDDPAALKKALFEAYPWHPRKYWPYRVWRQECRAVERASERLKNPGQLVKGETSLAGLPLFDGLEEE